MTTPTIDQIEAALPVPADVWACQQPGVPLVAAIVECSCSFDPMMTGRRRRTRLDCPVHGVHGLVALRDARCDLCWGTGFVDDLDNDGGSEPCPECHNGRLLVDVRVECGGLMPDCQEAHPTEPIPCDRLECDGYGYRTASGLIDVGVVVHCDDHHAGRTPKGDAIVVGCAGGLPLLWREERATYEQLLPAHVDALAAACGKPPADWVGGWAVVLTEEAE